MTAVTRTCPRCGKPHTFDVPQRVLDAWDGGRGEYIQRAWPGASPEQREALLTGFHPLCWDAEFPEED